MVSHVARLPLGLCKNKQMAGKLPMNMSRRMLHVGLACNRSAAVSGFRVHVGRIILKNGARADVVRSAVYGLCFFLCASEFGGEVLVGALEKLLRAVGAELRVTENSAAQA